MGELFFHFILTHIQLTINAVAGQNTTNHTLPYTNVIETQYFYFTYSSFFALSVNLGVVTGIGIIF